MKVLLVEIWGSGGTSVYAAELASALAAARREPGDEVHLAAPLDFEGGGANVVAHYCLPLLTGGSSGRKIIRAFRYLISWSLQQRTIAKLIRNVKPDVVHFLGTTVASGRIYRLAARMKIPTVVTVHDLPRGGDSNAKAVGLRVTSASFTSATRILVHGDWTLERIRKEYSSAVAAKTAIVPFGLFTLQPAASSRDITRARFGIPSTATVLLFFGNIRENKGLADLLSAFGNAHADEVWLAVAGSPQGKSERPLESYAKDFSSNPASSRVAWIARAWSESEVAEIFAMSDGLVMPYHASFGSQSAVLSLAISASLPVIATDVGEIGPTVRHYEIGVSTEPGSIPDLTRAIEMFAGNRFDIPESRFVRARQEMSWESAAMAMWTQYRISAEESVHASHRNNRSAASQKRSSVTSL
jgi:glycosyltransferase involved in cell wall biosynthesis